MPQKKPHLISRGLAKKTADGLRLNVKGKIRMRAWQRRFFDRAGKTKVVFVCPGGMNASFVGKSMFEKLLRKRRLSKQFGVDYAGWQQPQRILAADLRSAHFVVPMYPEVVGKILGTVAGMRRKPTMVNIDFHGIGGQYSEEKYRRILERILSLRGQR